MVENVQKPRPPKLMGQKLQTSCTLIYGKIFLPPSSHIIYGLTFWLGQGMSILSKRGCCLVNLPVTLLECMRAKQWHVVNQRTTPIKLAAKQ